MADDVRPAEPQAQAGRRRGHRLTTVAALLLLGGGVAVTSGIAQQQSAPQPRAVQAEPAGTASSAPPAPPSPQPPRPPSSSPSAPPSAPAPEVAAPTELRIPSIGVVSPLAVVGLRADGTLNVPQPGPDYDKAAWFSGSPRPGRPGPAVIEGHVDSAKNGPSVFYELGAVRPGNAVEVVRQDGSTATFVVDAVRSYPKDDFPTLEVYGNTPGPELRLITCGGEFDSTGGHYTHNIVVFAHLT